MDEKMHFMTEPEELLNWMKEHEGFIMYPIGWTNLKVHSLKSDR